AHAAEVIAVWTLCLSGQGRDRTADTRIFSPLLYQLSYLAKSAKSSRHTGLGQPCSSDSTAGGFPLASSGLRGYSCESYTQRPTTRIHLRDFRMNLVRRLLIGALAIAPAVAAAQGQKLSVPYTLDTLPNGLTVIVHEDHAVPIVTVNIWFHVGSGDEKPGRTGFAH